MNKSKLYTLLSVLTLSGYLWLVYCYITDGHGVWKGCLTRQFLHLPCPSCGTTHAVKALVRGDVYGAFFYNPFGFLVAVAMLVIPVWLVVDLLRSSDSLLRAYLKAEKLLCRPTVAVCAIVLVLLNWIWNIIKYA